MGGGDPSAGFEDFDVNDVFSQFFGGGGGSAKSFPICFRDVAEEDLNGSRLFTSLIHNFTTSVNCLQPCFRHYLCVS